MRNIEAVLLGVRGDFGVVVLGQALLVLLFPDVAQTLKEKKAENIVLVVARIDRSAEDIGGTPEVTFQMREGQFGGGGVEIGNGHNREFVSYQYNGLTDQ